MKFRFLCMLVIGLLAFENVTAQVTTYSLKKGQAFDILLFDTNEGTKETLDRYFKSAIPVGVEYGYMPQKGFKGKENIEGNYLPKTVIIGLWKDFNKREAFVNEITDRVSDIHEMRREIWSPFYLTYWEVKEDQEVTVDRSKFNVMTAYWMEDNLLNKFSTAWQKQVKNSGGSTPLTLTEGTSPYGYYYNPDFLTITSWESRDDFESFQKEAQKLGSKGLMHINQFIIE